MNSKIKLKTKIEYAGQSYSINSVNGFDLSLKNNFDGKNPIFFNAKQSSITAIQNEEFTGDLMKGGSCNVYTANVDIHCNGTHTECISHINDVQIKIVDVCPNELIPSQLISLKPEKISDTKDSYHVNLTSELVISQKMIADKIKNPVESLIIRTLPNFKFKKSRNYDENPAPFFTSEAIEYINELSIEHLLVDMPSIDKADDGGMLGNHHAFFKKGKTISELLYISNSIKDGFGFLQIQIPNWNLDAAPSRPIFYPM